MEFSKNIFNAIGKLFYAVAAVDKTIHPRELQTISDLMGKEVGTSTILERDTTFLINSEVIMNSFYSMQYSKTPSYDAFNEFVSYKQTHEHEFTPAIKKWIWQIADKITYSFSGKNKSELIMLSKLKSVLKD
jgi:hypothetical protein